MNKRPNEHARSEPIPSPDLAGRPEQEEDEGIDASEYVRQLIARTKPEVPTTPSKPPAPPVLKKAKQAQSFGPDSSLGAAPSAGEPCWLDDLLSTENDGTQVRSLPIRAAREPLFDLKQLREAANMMASSALDESDSKHLIGRAYTQLALALFGMAMSLVLMTTSGDVKSLPFVASVAMLVLAAIATYRFAATTRLLGAKTGPRH